MTDTSLHITSNEATVAIAVVRAKKLLQAEPRLVSAYTRERLKKALELASTRPEYATKLVDVKV